MSDETGAFTRGIREGQRAMRQRLCEMLKKIETRDACIAGCTLCKQCVSDIVEEMNEVTL